MCVLLYLQGGWGGGGNWGRAGMLVIFYALPFDEWRKGHNSVTLSVRLK